MKRIFAALAAAALAAACAKKAPEAGVRLESRRLDTGTVQRREEPEIVEVDGTVVGRQEAALASRLAATVVEVRAVPGQTVRTGEVLVRLAPQESEGALEGARAGVAAARSALDLARRNLARYERLEGKGAAAAVELEKARQDAAAAEAALAAAHSALSRAETDRAQASLAAPFDAIVLEKLVAAGDLAAPGRPLVRLATRSGRRVEAAPAEDAAARLSVGDSVEVELSGARLSGVVAEIAGAVDPATRRRIVRVDLPAANEPAVGTFARLRLPGPRRPRVLAPSRAVVARGGLELAWAVGPDGVLALRYVRTGAAASGELVEIRSGLEPGERVVLDPPADLEAGTRVAS